MPAYLAAPGSVGEATGHRPQATGLLYTIHLTGSSENFTHNSSSCTLPPHDILRHSFHCRFTQVTISCTTNAVTASRFGVAANITGYEGALFDALLISGGQVESVIGHMHIVNAVLTMFDLSGGSRISMRFVRTSPRPSPHGRPAPACAKQHLTSEHVQMVLQSPLTAALLAHGCRVCTGRSVKVHRRV